MMLLTNSYETPREASEAWLRRAKQAGTITTLGGGWWRIDRIGRRRPIQGHGQLAALLVRKGLMTRRADGRYVLAPAEAQEGVQP